MCTETQRAGLGAVWGGGLEAWDSRPVRVFVTGCELSAGTGQVCGARPHRVPPLGVFQ